MKVIDGEGLKWDHFRAAAKLLIEREKTGHAARDLIIDLVSSSKKDQWNDWYRRILIKDLRCGVSEKTVNNVAKKMNLKYRVPVFSCMLAHDGAKHPKKIKGDYLFNESKKAVIAGENYSEEMKNLKFEIKNI